ncbi:MAG: argininosuccinate synthase [Xanthomonadales bacterium]|nr:argininosuccinate synthase [Xanthomonadales bacterium]
MTSQREAVVLAFSGGLDTSWCVLDLNARGFDVHTVFVTTGGIAQEEVEAIAERARALGAVEHHLVDGSEDLWNEFVVPLLWSHARFMGQYPLLCSDRYLIVRHCLDLCDRLGTRHFAHGCTGMGNDQVRFDQTVRSLGDYVIHAPIRDLQKQTGQVREREMADLSEAGFEPPGQSGRYSINANLLGVTISGSEIDEFEAPGDDTFQLTRPRAQWPEQPLRARIGFDRGIPVSLDDEALAGPEMLRRLNEGFGAHGVGRHLYTGDVTIGLKGRIVFECPGIDVLMTAHQALEDAVNTRLQNQFRSQVAQRWAELVYTGFFYEPHKADLEAYLKSSQSCVTGSVVVSTNGGAVVAESVKSDLLLRDPQSVYAQSCNWSPEEAEGFIKLLGNSSTIAARVRKGRG